MRSHSMISLMLGLGCTTRDAPAPTPAPTVSQAVPSTAQPAPVLSLIHI